MTNRLSPDGRWFWNGTQWVPAAAPVRQGAAGLNSWSSHVSPDGQWLWNGTQWLATRNVTHASTAPTPTPSTRGKSWKTLMVALVTGTVLLASLALGAVALGSGSSSTSNAPIMTGPPESREAFGLGRRWRDTVSSAQSRSMDLGTWAQSDADLWLHLMGSINDDHLWKICRSEKSGESTYASFVQGYQSQAGRDYDYGKPVGLIPQTVYQTLAHIPCGNGPLSIDERSTKFWDGTSGQLR